MKDVPLFDLIPALDLFALERLPETWRFSPVTSPPDWWLTLDAAGAKVTTLAERFPFLESFLREADDFWEDGTRPQLTSGIFVAEGSTGQILLRASALNLGKHCVLVLQRLHGEADIRPLLQRAREKTLECERLTREIEAARKPLTTIARRAGELLATDLTAAQRRLVEEIDQQTAQLAAIGAKPAALGR